MSKLREFVCMIRLFFLIGLMVLIGCSNRSQATLEDKIHLAENSLPSITGFIPWEKSSIYEQMHQHHIPGVSLAVIENYKVSFTKAYGYQKAGEVSPVTTETMFRAVGISSQISRFIALNFVEKGILSLHEDVNRYLKTWKVPDNEWTKKKAVSLHSLLKYNTAGFNEFYMIGYPKGHDVPSLYQVLEGLSPAKTPPARVVREPGKFKRSTNYWSVSFVVLEQLLEDVARKPYPLIAHEILLKPLKLQNTTYEQPLPQGYKQQICSGHQKSGMVDGFTEVYPTRAAMGLWTTPADLARILIEMMMSYRGLSSMVASADTIKQVINLDRPYYFWYSSGAGYYCYYAFNANRGQGIVIMINHDGGNGLRKEIIHSIFRAWGWNWGGDFLLTEKFIFSWVVLLALAIFILILLLGILLFIRETRPKV